MKGALLPYSRGAIQGIFGLMEHIAFSEMLYYLDNSEKPASILFASHNEAGERVGRKLFIEKALSASIAHRRKAGKVKAGRLERERKNPNHSHNYTRNITDTETGDIIKIKPYLIMEYGGRRVIL